MTRFRIVVLPITMALLFACGQQEQKNQKSVEQKAEELLETTREYTLQEKQAYMQNVRDEIDNMQQRIDNLEERALAVSTLPEEEIQEQLEVLRTELDDLWTTYRKLEAADESEWRQQKTRVDSAQKALQQSIKEKAAQYQ